MFMTTQKKGIGEIGGDKGMKIPLISIHPVYSFKITMGL
jgi:hypothetical protein